MLGLLLSIIFLEANLKPEQADETNKKNKNKVNKNK